MRQAESYVRVAERWGVRGNPTAHLVGADLDADPSLLAATNATCVHNPSAGGAGGRTQPWPELLGAGARTNIGTDTHSNDLLENVKLAVSKIWDQLAAERWFAS